MLRRTHRAFFGLRRFERMLKVPRQYANRLEHIDDDSALIMGASAARSPENVRALMRQNGVERVEDLLDTLPDQSYRANPLRRLKSLLRAITGALPYNPDVRRYRRLQKRGYFSRPDIHERIMRLTEFEQKGGDHLVQEKEDWNQKEK